jgi:hypothetical protein
MPSPALIAIVARFGRSCSADPKNIISGNAYCKKTNNKAVAGLCAKRNFSDQFLQIIVILLMGNDLPE